MKGSYRGGSGSRPPPLSHYWYQSKPLHPKFYRSSTLNSDTVTVPSCVIPAESRLRPLGDVLGPCHPMRTQRLIRDVTITRLTRHCGGPATSLLVPVASGYCTVVLLSHLQCIPSLFST